MSNLKLLIEQKCPFCGKPKLDVRVHSRVNYPFGKKSKPRLVKKRVEKVCRNVRKDNKGNLIYRCGYSSIRTFKY